MPVSFKKKRKLAKIDSLILNSFVRNDKISDYPQAICSNKLIKLKKLG